MDVLHARIQHGVGQGSFHSASVESGDGRDRIRFDYVYDCGARSGSGVSRALKRAVARLGLEHRAGSLGSGVLDVMVLSHYDSDHLNGAKQLCSLFKVRRIFLPFLSPVELRFVIASQAAALSGEQIEELHGMAHGGRSLWGSPVTMVRGGDGEEGKEAKEAKLSPHLDRLPQRDRVPGVIDDAPQSVRLTVRSATSVGGIDTVPAEMSHHDDMLAEFANGQQLWKLRFWNRGLDRKLVAEIEKQLTSCGFPLDKLEDPAGASHLISWLGIKKNRDSVVKAYGDAIKTLNPTWAHEAKNRGLANLLSLAMCAGPDFEVVSVLHKRRHHMIRYYWRGWWHCNNGVGKGAWLGTGDAPLGEAAVWADFQQHYANELFAVSTYLVPHHGAAPSGGLKYYNAGLNHTPGVASVISYGSNNRYGHPQLSVLSQILAQRGDLHEVTEACKNGFHEVLRFSDSWP